MGRNENLGTAAGSKFKVGQRVKWNGKGEDLIDHWMRYWATKGDDRPPFFYVTGITNGGRDITYSTTSSGRGPLCSASYFELAPLFAVGDKVRVVTMEWGKEQHGKTGTVICNNEISSFSDLDVTIEYDVPLGGMKTNSYRSSGLELIPSYTSCAAAEVDNLADEYGGKTGGLQIVAGRYYKTRDGRKVGPMRREESYYATDGWHYDIAGKCAYEGGSRDEVDEAYRQVHDLIAEWPSDDVPLRGVSPVVAPATTAASTAKFKVGDRVVDVSRSAPSGAGKSFGVVKGVGCDNVRVVWERDGTGGEFDWPASDFELVDKPTTMADIVRKHSGTAVVMLIENGQPKPATRPYVHADRASATTEAERLATTMPGSEFGVYELVTRRVADVVVREVV